MERKNTENFYRNILEASHDEIFVTDGEGNTIYCNKTFEKHYGVKPSDMLGKKVSYLIDNGYIDQSPIPVVLEKKKQITLDQKTSTGRALVLTATPIFDKEGNIDYIVENCRDITEIEQLKYNLEKTKKQLEKYKIEVQALREKELNADEITFKSQKLKSVFKTIDRISNVHASILLLGESGTGKTSIAQYIHKKSTRKEGPFITINCATIPSHLLESELFGYAPGAFTGAKKNGKIGLVELADGGTLFLDEVGEIPLNLQSKFLELIQEHRFTPVGDIKSKYIDMRIISATNQNLAELVKEKKFREDLYYRLNVINLEIPPLKERPEDIKDLISYFLEKYNLKYHTFHEFSKESKDILLQYSWPGNIRELQHMVEQLVVTIPKKIIKPYDLPRYIHQSSSLFIHENYSFISLDAALEEVEKRLILNAYKQFKSSYKVANALSISQTKANRLIRKYTACK